MHSPHTAEYCFISSTLDIVTIYPTDIYEKTGTQNIETVQGHLSAKVRTARLIPLTHECFPESLKVLTFCRDTSDKCDQNYHLLKECFILAWRIEIRWHILFFYKKRSSNRHYQKKNNNNPSTQWNLTSCYIQGLNKCMRPNYRMWLKQERPPNK